MSTSRGKVSPVRLWGAGGGGVKSSFSRLERDRSSWINGKLLYEMKNTGKQERKGGCVEWATEIRFARGERYKKVLR